MSRSPDANWFCFLTLLHFASICSISTQNVIIVLLNFASTLLTQNVTKNQNVTIIRFLHFAVYQRHPRPDLPSVTCIYVLD